MRLTRTLAVLLASSFLLLAVACGGDDNDDDSSSRTGSGSSDAAPTATEASSGGDAVPTSPPGGSGGSSSSGDSVGSVTVGDETWMIVASGGCEFEAVECTPIVAVTIDGHAEGDESIQISIKFDPRDIGLQLTVEGPGGDPGWSANNESFTTGVGPTSISGNGTFDSTSGGGTSVLGSFEARC